MIELQLRGSCCLGFVGLETVHGEPDMAARRIDRLLPMLQASQLSVSITDQALTKQAWLLLPSVLVHLPVQQRPCHASNTQACPA